MVTGRRSPAVTVQESFVTSLKWRCIGPHRGGRVVAVAGDVSDPMTFYFGACAGGVWKTTDGGRFWRNISDGFFGTAAIGALAVSESEPNVIYAGTGETSIRNDVSHGDGLYKSTNGGRTWTNIGLRDSRHIGKIVIHPHNPDLVYVAALGHAYGPNEERGVFRTKDGGKTWEKILYKSERAGSHDVTMDLNNPQILFASIWQVQRYPHTLINGGPESGLWRSPDGGDTWQEITRKPGLPASVLGKIGVSASRAQPGRVWALIEAEDGAMFRSDDYGETWTRLSEESLLRTRPWYYMHVTSDPSDPETVWVQNYSLWKSSDGGATFTTRPSQHGDEHALWIDPHDSRRMVKGDDGGASVTFNGGVSWSTILNQPTAQMYHVTTDNNVPYRVYGSQQDNTAISVPSRSVDGAIHERDWFAPGGGESGYIAIKPDDNQIVVASGPKGRRIYNDIMTMYDRRTKQAWINTVWPELYGWGAGAESLKYRFQWTFPIVFSQHEPDALYVGGNQVFRSHNLGANWEAVSPDLTRNDPDKLKPSGGPITRDNTGAEVYCTVFALAESPVQAGVFWAGSDDGLVHISRDNCATWTAITPPDLPEWALISIIEPSSHDPATAYVAATRYKLDDTTPYLFKTNDYGKTWTKITNGIPAHDFTRTIREDPARRGLLYAGTETGIYVSFDDGVNWQRLSGNLPVVPIYDLIVKGHELVVATHGRSFWILDDLSPFHELRDGIPDTAAHLFAPGATMRMRGLATGFWRGPKPGFVNYSHADTSLISILPTASPDGTIDLTYLDAGENPAAGVVFSYYLREKPEGDLTLTIKDDRGNELRTYSAEKDKLPAAVGMNRFVWNFTLPAARSVTASDLQAWDRADGPMVLPGTYQATLTVGDESVTVPFTIAPDPRIKTSAADLAAQFTMLKEITATLDRTNQTLNDVDDIRSQLAFWRQRIGDSADYNEVRGQIDEIAGELADIRRSLIDVNMKQSQLWPSGLHEKFNALFDSVNSADYAPPQQARDVFSDLSGQLDELSHRFDQIVGEDAPRLQALLATAGLPAVGLAE